MFDFSQLRCFATVAEELHFGRAAARLNMTQPPLSRQIQVLERVLDVQLLDRTSRSVRLTAAGRSFLPEAQRILRLAETATHVTRQVAAGRAGVLKLGFTAASAYDFLPRLVIAARAELPEVALSLREMVTKDQVEELLAGRIDAALVRPPVTHPDLASVRALAEPMLVAVPADNPLAERAALSLADLDREAFITYAAERGALLPRSGPRPDRRGRHPAAHPAAADADPLDPGAGARRPRGLPGAGGGRTPALRGASNFGRSSCPCRVRPSFASPGGATATTR